jgi:hypothetical protein
VYKGIRSAIKTEFISGRSYWCDIIILNVHAPTEDENDTNIAFTRHWSMCLIV